ncbi:hypothetical protein [uncultured Porphyromonas sp.]|uniref:hypothetical protein n=1 Tax=uncultured Porphyromonas sp. TaxID=159274 RepID=UPI00260ADA2E|nr:hypothetical protein [uncultured Porphyromonas sp.]
METTTDNLSKALLDVRRAHRILYAYQRRMLDLVHFIQSKLDMLEFRGIKHFSKPIYGRSIGHTPLNIWPTMWAWDYLYSYLFEYYLGEKEAGDKLHNYKLSLIQYSDTGYFDQDGQKRGRISEFGSEEESSSKLLFFLEYKSKDSEWEWKDGSYMEGIVLDKKVGSKKHTKEVRYTSTGGKQILYSFPLERLNNMEATLKVLSEFCSYCQEQGIHVFDNLTLEPTCTSTSSSSEG